MPFGLPFKLTSDVFQSYREQWQGQQMLEQRYEVHHRKMLQTHQQETFGIQAMVEQKEQEMTALCQELQVIPLGSHDTAADNS